MSKHEISENKRMLKEEMIADALFEHDIEVIKKDGISEEPKNIDGVNKETDSTIVDEGNTEENQDIVDNTEESEEIENPDIGSLGSFNNN